MKPFDALTPQGRSRRLHGLARLALAAYELTDELGCRHLQVIGPYEGSIDDAAAAFGRLVPVQHGAGTVLLPPAGGRRRRVRAIRNRGRRIRTVGSRGWRIPT